MSETKQLIAARVARLVAEFGDEPAALYQGERYPWSYVGAFTQFLDDALADLDGAPAAVVLRPRPNCLAATIALWASGRGVTLVSPIHPDDSIADELRSLEPAVVIADVEDWARPGFADACAGAVAIELGPVPTDPIALRGAAPRAVAARVPAPSSYAATITTSGTTGTPKRYGIAWDDVRPDAPPRDPPERRGVLINALPLFSIGGVRAISTVIFGGRPIALMDRFDVTEWAALIRDHRPRRAGAPPAVLRMVLDARIPAEWLSSVASIYTASAPLSMQLADEFESLYGIPIVQGYGATEFLGGVTGWPGDLYEKWGREKRGSVGRPIPGISVRVVDQESGVVLEADEVGNLEVDSPYRAQGVPPGWVPTNDLARIDADGFVWILGRSDDVIIRGGFKVSLFDVEAALLEHPQVHDVCVVGLPDPRLGEVPAALVVAGETEPPDEDELVEFVRTRLPAYMSPALVTCRTSMPLNSMLKKDRSGITSLLLAEREARRQSA